MNIANGNQQVLTVSATSAKSCQDHNGQSLMDWGHFGNSGGHPLYGFVLTLSYSRMCYLEFTHSNDIPQLMVSMVNGFGYFGGVPKDVLTDRLNIAMLEQSGSELRFDKKFLEFAAYCGFLPRVCHGPETKGEIKSTMRIVRQSPLPGIAFGSLADLNQQAHAWMENLNRQIHPITREIPCQRLLQERLLPIDALLNCDKSFTEESSLRDLQG